MSKRASAWTGQAGVLMMRMFLTLRTLKMKMRFDKKLTTNEPRSRRSETKPSERQDETECSEVKSSKCVKSVGEMYI